MKNKLYLAFSFKYENILKIFCLCRYKIKLQQMVLTLYSFISNYSKYKLYYYNKRNSPRPNFNLKSRIQVSNPKSKIKSPEERDSRLTKRKKMNLSSITVPDYGKMCPNFWFWEIQFIQSQAWTWSHLRVSHCPMRGQGFAIF